jgi:hypothetical protein
METTMWYDEPALTRKIVLAKKFVSPSIRMFMATPFVGYSPTIQAISYDISIFGAKIHR